LGLAAQANADGDEWGDVCDDCPTDKSSGDSVCPAVRDAIADFYEAMGKAWDRSNNWNLISSSTTWDPCVDRFFGVSCSPYTFGRRIDVSSS
jgi:hypothetical protein